MSVYLIFPEKKEQDKAERANNSKNRFQSTAKNILSTINENE